MEIKRVNVQKKSKSKDKQANRYLLDITAVYQHSKNFFCALLYIFCFAILGICVQLLFCSDSSSSIQAEEKVAYDNNVQVFSGNNAYTLRIFFDGSTKARKGKLTKLPPFLRHMEPNENKRYIIQRAICGGAIFNKWLFVQPNYACSCNRKKKNTHRLLSCRVVLQPTPDISILAQSRTDKVKVFSLKYRLLYCLATPPTNGTQ